MPDFTVPHRAMVMAAGYGSRLGPLTEDRPKPLTPVLGKAMLDVILDRLAAIGVAEVVVNNHYLGHKIEQHLAVRQEPRILHSHEAVLLETGGGFVKALPLLGQMPVYVLNGDMVWTDHGQESALARLARAYDPQKMSALLLLQPLERAGGYRGRGDFFMESDGRLRHRGRDASAPYVFTGLRMMDPLCAKGYSEKPFSVVDIFHRLIVQGRLYGLVHQGAWFDVGTPDSLARAEEYLKNQGIASLI